MFHTIAGFAENITANCAKNHAFQQMLDLYQDYMGLWNRVLGFGKDVDKYYILLSPNISILLPKSNFSIFLIKN